MKFSFRIRPEYLLLGLTYFVTRLLFLSRLPMFTDEAIYIYWAKLIQTGQASPFLSIVDGKPPLFIWSMIPGLFIPSGPQMLVVSRLVSVIAGGVSLVGIYYLGKLLFQKSQVGFWSAIVYVFLPFTLQYDRLALMDSLLTTSFIWSMVFFYGYLQKSQIKYLLLTSFVIGLGYLTKPAALLIPGLLSLMSVYYFTEKKKIRWRTLVAVLISAIPIVVVDSIFRLSDAYFQFHAKNAQFQRSFSEILSQGLTPFLDNFSHLITWIGQYHTWPLFLIFLIGLALIFIKDKLKSALILSLWLAPLLLFSLRAEILFPRYILFTNLITVITIGYFITQVSQLKQFLKMITLGVLGVSLISVVLFDWQILINPVSAPYPQPDYDQFIGESPSGYSLKPIRDYLDQQLKAGNSIELVTEGTFGLLPYYFQLYYWDNPRISITGEWPLTMEQETLSVVTRDFSLDNLQVLVEGTDPQGKIEYRLIEPQH